jgi:hypothetical protein
LPPRLATLRQQTAVPEIAEPLRLYELEDALPRAFHVGRAEFVDTPAALKAKLDQPGLDPRERVLILGGIPPERQNVAAFGSGTGVVHFERLDPHRVRVRCSGAPGYVVVLEGHHRDWQAFGPAGPVPVLKAYERYWALPTPGGDQVYVVRYAPSWRLPAFILSSLGALGAVLTAIGGAASKRWRARGFPRYRTEPERPGDGGR